MRNLTYEDIHRLIQDELDAARDMTLLREIWLLIARKRLNQRIHGDLIQWSYQIHRRRWFEQSSRQMCLFSEN